MSWEQWSSRRRRRFENTSEHAAIDILVEEAKPHVPGARRRPLLRAILNESHATITPSDGRGHAHSRGDEAIPGSKSLPSRIRINSAPIRRILNSVCDEPLRVDGLTGALIIVRPYKLLTHYEGEIRQRMGEIESIHQERLNQEAALDRSNIEASGTHVLDTANGAKIDENGVAKDEREPGTVAVWEDVDRIGRRGFSQDMLFSTEPTEWSKLTDAEVKEATDDFRCLVRFLDETLTPVRHYLQAQPKEIAFHNIWHLYSTGALVYVRDRSIPQKTWKIIQATGGRRYLSEPEERITGWETKFSPFVLDCYHLDFDGTKFVRVYHRFEIEMFENPILVSSLRVMPLVVAERTGLANIEHLRKRGMEFLSYSEPSPSHHREYHGVTVTQSPSGGPLYRRDAGEIDARPLFTERVDSQVVVDFERAIRANPDWGPVNNEIELFKIDPSELDDRMDDVEKDDMWDARASDDLLKEEEGKWQRWDKGETRPEGDDVLLFPNRVFGFVLRSRSWGKLRRRRQSLMRCANVN